MKLLNRIVALSFSLFLVACSNAGGSSLKVEDSSASDSSVVEEENVEVEETTETNESRDVLVVYFSATGTTKGVAEKIAAITKADLYEIVPAIEYTSEDLHWQDESTRATVEQKDANARPEISSETISLEGYQTIYIGFPIWWGEEPRIMDSFVESYDFDGKTLIPFCTSGSSGIGNSGKNLAGYAGSGNWLEGKRFSATTSEAELEDWINSLQ